MKTNSTPADLLLQRKSNPEILAALLAATDDDTAKAVALLDEAEVAELHCIGVDRVKSAAISSTIIAGGIFTICHSVAYGRGTPSLFQDLLDDSGIRLNSAHRCMQIFRSFGVYLLKEPKLLLAFTGVAPLDVLSMRQTRQGARDEAIESARKGQKIDTNFARVLKAKHQDAVLSSSIELPKLHEASCAKSSPSAWKFNGRFVRAKQVKITCKSSAILLEIVKELETAIQEIRGLLAPGISLNRVAE